MLSWVRDYGSSGAKGPTWRPSMRRIPTIRVFTACFGTTPTIFRWDRFQKPGNWNDADFIIGGDGGMSVAETRSQLALWSMMSAPLILSSDLDKTQPGGDGDSQQ